MNRRDIDLVFFDDFKVGVIILGHSRRATRRLKFWVLVAIRKREYCLVAFKKRYEWLDCGFVADDYMGRFTLFIAPEDAFDEESFRNEISHASRVALCGVKVCSIRDARKARHPLWLKMRARFIEEIEEMVGNDAVEKDILDRLKRRRKSETNSESCVQLNSESCVQQKSPEPTPGTVTPRADARVAPAPGAAHL
jgi:hypothetical protein